MALGYAKPGFVYMDIGANHGYLSLALEEREIRVYATENKTGPFLTLQQSLLENGSRIQSIFTDGLDLMPPDVSGVFLLGMGSKTMEDILFREEGKLNRLSHLVIEPQTDCENLLSRLHASGFEEEGGSYVFEKHYYPVLSLVRSTPLPHTMAEERYGAYPLHHKDPLLKEKLEKDLSSLLMLSQKGIPGKEDEIEKIREALDIWNSGN